MLPNEVDLRIYRRGPVTERGIAGCQPGIERSRDSQVQTVL